jgi:hypothetical protein
MEMEMVMDGECLGVKILMDVLNTEARQQPKK